MYDPFPQGGNGPISAAEHCRILDLPAPCQVDRAAGLFLPFTKSTLRTSNAIDLKPVKNMPPTLILKCYCIPNALDHWQAVYSLAFTGLVDGPTRLVFNVSYQWADQVFASDMGVDALPKSVTELVIHFKKIDGGERPRYILCRVLHDTDNHERIASFGTTSTVPVLKPDEHLELVYPPEVQAGRSLFERLADLFADAVGRGKVRANKKTRTLKLTLVGLGEFDRARDDDADDDDAFAAVVPLLPICSRLSPRSVWGHPEYHSISDTFIDSVLKRVHKTKHEVVKKSIKIMSSSEYFEHLAPQHREEEEDWWCAHRDLNRDDVC
jgi:hypothetical protein